jgi:hypothetical protein
MEAWRARLQASWELLLEDDEEDDLNMNLILGQGFNNQEVALPRVARGSCPGKAANIERYRHQMHERMMEDYFCDAPVYGPSLFRRRYRMQRSLFLSIMEWVCARDNYFVQKRDATGCLGLSPYQKITYALLWYVCRCDR